MGKIGCSLSNNPNLPFDSVMGSIFNEGSGSANVARGRTEKKSENVQRNRSKSKGKAEVTCYQCGRKGRKKPDCRYYKAELERKKNTGDKKKKDIENEARNNFKDKDKEKANVASNVIMSSLRSHKMHNIFFVLLYQHIMLKLMVLLFLFMHRI